MDFLDLYQVVARGLLFCGLSKGLSLLILCFVSF